MSLLQAVIEALDLVIFTYFVLYCAVNLGLLAIATFSVRRSLEEAHVLRRPDDAASPFAPLVSLIVPAYNEEVTIVDSLRSLLRLQYPRFEVIVVNDGSKDETTRVLREAFDLVRNDVDYNPLLGTSPVRGFYRSRAQLPPAVERLVLVDKANGGKADAINAGLNASRGTFVTTMDADSLIGGRALTAAIQPFLDDPTAVVATGGQVALSNGCRVQDGELVSVGLSGNWLARFQVVEYMRSFTQSRVALGELDSLLILSGVFAVFQRELLLAAGGFLTKHMRSRIGREYCGPENETVCEDMEVVVRLHRYSHDHRIRTRVVMLPFPLAWTEAPEVWRNLGKQRNRWYRGLWEVLSLHRAMIFNPRYGAVGLFALPYQLLFEALAPIVEATGYLLVPLSYLGGILSLEAMLSFVAVAVAFSAFLSTGSVLLAVWRLKLSPHEEARALIDYRGFRTLGKLVVTGFVGMFGYRQYLIWWQLRGLRDFLAGRKSWDKFARKGFQPKGGES